MNTISKVDEERRMVFGWANVSIDKTGDLITDSQDDQIDIEDLETAAYEFALNYREAGVNHQGESVGALVEDIVITEEKLELWGLEKNALPLGFWVGFKIFDDDVWQDVKSGDLSMFSIQGTAVREEA